MIGLNLWFTIALTSIPTPSINKSYCLNLQYAGFKHF